jgi:zinc protease
MLPMLLLWAGNANAALDIQTGETDNGARFYFVETRQLPMVQLSVGFDAGSARDPQDKLGLAHLVNLMVEEGAADLDGESIALALESVGAQYSNENGRDMSVFELRSLSDPDLLQPAARVFAKILSAPTFPKASLDRERQRLLIRLAQQQQSPRDVVTRAFYANLFDGHPYAKPPDGDAEGVQRIVRRDLTDFHRDYFVGANAVMALVGDLSRAEAEQLVQQVVGGLPRGRAAEKVAAVPELNGGALVDIQFPSNQSHLLMGQPGVSRHDLDYFPLYVGNHILGGSGLISRLSVAIREERGLAYSVYSYFLPMRDRGPFIIGLQTRNDQTSLAERLARETVASFVAEGPSAEELEAAKKNITGGFPLLIDSNRKIAGNLLNMAFYGLPLDYLETYSDRIDAVTAEQIRDAFRRRVDPERLVRVVVGGSNG